MASSSGVLGYLFEGLTETSWLTDEVGADPGGVMGTFRGRDDLDVQVAQGREMA